MKNKTKLSLLSCQCMTNSSMAEEIILGSLLGDGSLQISKGYKNARFSFRHSIKQQEYFLWKRNALRDQFSSEKDMWEQKNWTTDFGSSTSSKLRYQSKALPRLSQLFNITHKRGEKGQIRIWRKWLNKMTPLSLAIWWCDDGSLVCNTKHGVFCTDGFLLDDLVVLDRYMKMVWGIRTAIHPVGKSKKDGTQRYRLWIRSITELKKFLRIIIPYIPTNSMLYKVLILYKDSELQQRWISEIVQNSNFTEEQVQTIVTERKRVLKAFSENEIVRSNKTNLEEGVCAI